MCEAEGLEDLSPAPKLVYRVLEEIGPATRAKVQGESLLPRRTTSDAIERLADEDLIQEVGSADPKPVYDVLNGGEER
jgi:hypothetical protein